MYQFTTAPHNPYCRLISDTLPTPTGHIELVYSEENDGSRPGLEVYFYRTGEDHFYHSRRWDKCAVPRKYMHNNFQPDVVMLSGLIDRCPAGHKLTLI